jgi:multiple sugar transport system ATP-binding protein
VLGIRPEDIQDCLTLQNPNPEQIVEVKVEVSEPMGAETYLYLQEGATSFIARVNPTDRFKAGQKVKLCLNLDKAHLFDATTEQVLR